MAKRIIYDADFINFVMTPPRQEEFAYNDVKLDTVKVIGRDKRVEGLGELPIVSMNGGSEQQSWVMPVVIIVVSAMAFMTLYSVLCYKR